MGLPRRIVNVGIVVIVVIAFTLLRGSGNTPPLRGMERDTRSTCTARCTNAIEEPRIDRAKVEEEARSLDRKYIHGLIGNAHDPDSVYRAFDVAEQLQRQQSKYTAGIVIGRMTKETEKVQWVLDNLIDVKPYIYIVDDNTTEEYHLERNHGREAAVYLTYIVEHYDNLPDISFFWHGDDVVWHNNMLMGWNSSISVNRMDRENVIRSGYVPSRCDHWPGCMASYSPNKPERLLTKTRSCMGTV